MLLRKSAWKPEHQTAQDEKTEGEATGILDGAERLVPISFKRRPAVEIAHIGKEDPQLARACPNNRTSASIGQQQPISSKSNLGRLMRIREERYGNRRRMSSIGRIYQKR